MSDLEQLKTLLHQYGTKVYANKSTLPIKSLECIDNVPTSSGIYWIETTMPAHRIQAALETIHQKEKKVRKKPPQGAALIHQKDNDWYVIYSGTEENIRKRLKQHLFNEGNAGTVKMGCILSQNPFDSYKWRISYHVIESFEIRYAVEAWWRLNIGWPLFCLR